MSRQQKKNAKSQYENLMRTLSEETVNANTEETTVKEKTEKTVIPASKTKQKKKAYKKRHNEINEARRRRYAEKKAEQMAAEMASNLQAEREVTAERNGTETKQVFSRGYSDAEANEARKLVKNFDLLQPAARRAIIELYRSGKASGASQTFMRHAANLIAYWRTGLWIIADDKIRDDGFFYVFDDGTRLITVKPAAEGRSITEAFMHELGHDVWERADKETRHELYRMAISGVDKTKLREIRKRYQTELTERGETVTNELLYEEIFANLLGEYIGTEDFLSRFGGGDVSALTRIKKTLSVMKKRFTGKDKYLYRKADDLFRAFTKVMAGQAVTNMNRENVHVSEEMRYAKAKQTNFREDKYFSSQIEKFESLKQGGYITVGEITEGSPLDKVGIPSGKLYFDVSKIIKEMKLRKDAITAGTMKEIPKVLGAPIVITEYVDQGGLHSVNVYGKLYVGSSPVVIGVMVAQSPKGNIVTKIQTVHPNRNVLKEMTDDNILYLLENKKETKQWFQSLGTQTLPLRGTKFGLIRSISQNSKKSTSSEKKVSENNGSKRSALPKTVKTLANVALNETDKKRVEKYNRALTEYLKICRNLS